ncbi:MAG TPA: thymidylate synthase [Actinomycetes bacterium]|nr:thymidylate synthase [Actinomycetes bacterium]
MSWDDLFREIVAGVLDAGDEVRAGAGLSVGAGQVTRERLNCSFELAEPRDRLLFNPRCRFNLCAAVGRFAWMMSGSDRLADIEYYDLRGRDFSDDGLVVPGSCDGARLLSPRRGLDQLARVVDLLRHDPGTRRAVAVIYHPEDAGRVSRDIPCHIAVGYNLRDGALHCTTLMRSSNAARVLPYDLFLFTLLAEVVACMVGASSFTYHQFAISMHVYAKDLPAARAIVTEPPPARRRPMPPMPSASVAGDVRTFLEIEREFRASHLLADSVWLADQQLRIQASLPGFWQDFAQVLLVQAVRRCRLEPSRRTALEAEAVAPISDPFKALVARREVG